MQAIGNDRLQNVLNLVMHRRVIEDDPEAVVDAVRVLAEAGLDLDYHLPRRKSASTATYLRGEDGERKICFGDRSVEGETPLTVAIRYGTPELVSAIVETGVNVDSPTSHGIRPLAIARQRKDNLSKTGTQAAYEESQATIDNIIQILESKGAGEGKEPPRPMVRRHARENREDTGHAR